HRQDAWISLPRKMVSGGDVCHFFWQAKMYGFVYACEFVDVEGTELTQPVHHFLHQSLRRRRPGRHADRLDPIEPLLLKFGDVVDQITGHAHVGPDLAQTTRIRAVHRPDHEQEIDLAAQIAHGTLPVLGRVADVSHVKADDG